MMSFQILNLDPWRKSRAEHTFINLNLMFPPRVKEQYDFSTLAHL